MSLKDELRDPWGAVVAGVSGGMTWAVLATAVGGPAAVAAGVGVGAAVLGVKAVSGALVNRGEGTRRSEPAGVERPPRGSAAGRWLAQAEKAVRAMDDMADNVSAGPSAGPTAAAVRSAAEDADDALLALGRVAAQVVAVERALSRVEDASLDGQAARLERQLAAATTDELRREVERSTAAVRERVEVRDRLRSTRATLLARMQSVTLGLEGLVARLAELLALAETTGHSDDAARGLADVTAELDGLRSGLAESEAVSRRVLDATPGELPPS